MKNTDTPSRPAAVLRYAIITGRWMSCLQTFHTITEEYRHGHYTKQRL
jgi:hypothetical protein